MVSCCDSRVDPGILFDVDPGEIFVIRNVANLVPPYETSGNYHGTSAALEFAVTCLQVKQIVVLGHANCGGIRSLMENDTSFQAEGFIDSWMNLAAAAKKEVLARDDLHDMQQKIHACEKTAVSHSLRNLMLYPWIKQRVNEGELELLGCFYDLRNGDLLMLDKIGSNPESE
jgi:carbonic anhydrase